SAKVNCPELSVLTAEHTKEVVSDYIRATYLNSDSSAHRAAGRREDGASNGSSRLNGYIGDAGLTGNDGNYAGAKYRSSLRQGKHGQHIVGSPRYSGHNVTAIRPDIGADKEIA